MEVMHQKMLSRFVKFATDHHLFYGKAKVLLAVSGGIDSIVMMELFIKAGINISIAHCNFGLRGKESGEDAAFLKALCKEKKVRLHVKKFNTENFAKREKISVQMAARKLRYDWFDALMQENDYSYLATAHHLDDSVETFFINLLRGTGIKGLSGIPESNLKLIRPLSAFTKQEIVQFAKASSLAWREDSSNDSTDYLRNKVRHKLIPLLNELQPGFNVVMKKNLENLSQSSRLQEEVIHLLKKKYVQSDHKGNSKIRLSILKKEIEGQSKLSLLLLDAGVKPALVPGIISSETSGKIFYCEGLRILRDRNELIISKEIKSKNEGIHIAIKDKEIRLNEHIIRFNTIKKTRNHQISHTQNMHQLDRNKLRFPLSIRPWKPGDFFYPLGMSHRKKISDFLVDCKMNRFDKENCKVLLTGTDIVCILGHRIDDRYKVNPQTKLIFTITLQNEPTE